MRVSNRLYKVGLVLAASVLVAACSPQSNGEQEVAQNLSPGVNSTEPSLASANDARSQWLEKIENSGLVDVAEINEEIDKIRTDLIIDQYFESLYAIEVGPEDIENYYRENQDEFTSEQVQIAHILIRTPAASSTETRAAAATNAHDLVSKLHIGEDFATLAEQESEDKASSNNGGELGWVTHGQIPDGVMKAALALESGEVSEPVIEKYGIHIIKKMSPTRVQAKPLYKVRARISQQLRTRVKEQAIENLTVAKQ